jgi:hypothetical protein
MDSPPTDKLLPKGVAAIVHDLVEFSPVQELFQTHIQLWRENNALIADQRRKAEAELATFWRDEPHAPDPFKDEHWPARRIYSPDRSKSELFPIPPELNDKLNEYNDPSRYHLLCSLDNRQDFSTTESFIMLADLHDAAYQSSPIGYAIDHIVSVAEAADILKKGMSQVAAQNLATLAERVLDLIEARADSKSTNKTGKTLQQIIQRSRDKLADIGSLPHLGKRSDRRFVKGAIEASQSKLLAAIETQGRSRQTESLVSADQLGAFAGVGGKVIRNALRNADCKPWIKSTGKGNPHWWRYCDAVEALQTVKSGKLRSFKWPEAAAEVLPQKDSSKIPAKT